MARINVSKDPPGRIIVSFPYDALLVAEVKTIEGMASCRKTLEFSNAPYPPHRWGREREGVKKLESGLSPKFNASSKTTEINTHVSTKNIGKIKSPLDNLNLNRGGDVWGELKEEILAYGQRWYTLTAQCRYIKGAPKRISKA